MTTGGAYTTFMSPAPGSSTTRITNTPLTQSPAASPSQAGSLRVFMHIQNNHNVIHHVYYLVTSSNNLRYCWPDWGEIGQRLCSQSSQFDRLRSRQVQFTSCWRMLLHWNPLVCCGDHRCSSCWQMKPKDTRHKSRSRNPTKSGTPQHLMRSKHSLASTSSCESTKACHHTLLVNWPLATKE